MDTQGLPVAVFLFCRVVVVAVVCLIAYIFNGRGGVLAAIALMGMLFLSHTWLICREGRGAGFVGIIFIFLLFLLWTFLVFCFSETAFEEMMSAFASWISALKSCGSS